LADNIDTTTPDLVPTDPEDVQRIGRSQRVSGSSWVLIGVLTIFFLAVFGGASFVYFTGGINRFFPEPTPLPLSAVGTQRVVVKEVKAEPGQKGDRDMTVKVTLKIADNTTLLPTPQGGGTPPAAARLKAVGFNLTFNYKNEISYRVERGGTAVTETKPLEQSSVVPINVDLSNAQPDGDGTYTLTQAVTSVDKRWDGTTPRVLVQYVLTQ